MVCGQSTSEAATYTLIQEVDPEDLVTCIMELKDGTVSTWDQTCINLSNNNQTVSEYQSDGLPDSVLTRRSFREGPRRPAAELGRADRREPD